MTGASYIPGTWLGVVRSRTAVLLGPGLPAELAGAVWELLAGRPEPHEVLAAVTSGSGGSLTQLPSFGILDFNGPLRVFLRGDIDLIVEQPGGAVDLDGRDVTTWNERKFVVPGRCRLAAASGSTGTGQAGKYHPELPLGEGVVLLQSLTLGVPSGPAAVHGPAGADSTTAPGTSPSAGGTFAVDSSGEVDGPDDSASGGAASRSTAEEGQPDAGAPWRAGGRARDFRGEPEESKTASAGTEVGAIGGEANPEPGVQLQAGQAGQAGDKGPGLPAGESFDPDATIAPGAIIDMDGERAVDAASLDSEGPHPAGGAAGAGFPGADAAGLDGAGLDAAGLDGAGLDAASADDDAAEAGSMEPGSNDSGSAGTGSNGSVSAGRNQADAASAVEMTSSYDHLWERTVMRNIEDAAVREEPDADSGHVLPQQQAALQAAEPLPALGAGDAAAQAAPEGASPSGPGDSAASSPGADAGSPAHPDPSRPDSPHPGSPQPDPAQPRPASPGLIDSVPWRTGTGTGTGTGAGTGTAEPGSAAAAPAPSVGTPPAPSAPPAPFATPAPSTPAAPSTQAPFTQAGGGNGPGQAFDPDHDGQTVMKSSLPGTASGSAPSGPAAGGPASGGDRQEAAGGPLVLARVCAQGHPNPPTRAQCSVCGSALLPDAVQVARPRLGRMRLSTGELLDLDESMIIGRQPSVSRVQGGVMPRLVQVASPGGDISRSHVEVRLEGWHVMLCDLKATNGTVLVREGQPPRRLAQNEMAILLDGDIAELGDNISMRFEEIP